MILGVEEEKGWGYWLVMERRESGIFQVPNNELNLDIYVQVLIMCLPFALYVNNLALYYYFVTAYDTY